VGRPPSKRQGRLAAISLITKGDAAPFPYWWIATEDVGEDLFEVAELVVAAKAPTDRLVERFQTARLFVLDPCLQLISNQLGGVGNQSSPSLPDEPGRDALLVADEKDWATRI